MRTTILVLAIAAVALSTSAVTAQVGAYLGPQIGYSKSSDTDGKVLFGAALRVNILSALGVEGSIDYREEDFVDGALTMRSWPVQVSGLFYPLPVIYGIAGVGWYHTTFDFSDSVPLSDETQREFGWHFGGGAEVPLGSVAKLGVDIRYVFLDYDFEAVPGTDNIDDDFYMVTAGFLFKL